MKYSKQLFFSALSIFSIQTKFIQGSQKYIDPKYSTNIPWTTRQIDMLEKQIDMLENDQYPHDLLKKITFTMPSCEENILVYIEQNGVSQRIRFSKENLKQTLVLVKPDTKENSLFRVSFIPESQVKIYLDYLKFKENEEAAPKDGVTYFSQLQEQNKKHNEALQKDSLMRSNFNKAKQQVINLEFNYLTDGQVITIPAYQNKEDSQHNHSKEDNRHELAENETTRK